MTFGGEAVADRAFPALVHDFALLHGLGIRLVLVHGARPQIEACLKRRGIDSRQVGGRRISDAPVLECVKEAAGLVRVEIEAMLSRGLADSSMAGARIPVASGNFVTARPLGVLDGVDYGLTGVVRRIDRNALRNRLDDGAIVVISPLGYSPTGEVFNVSANDLACAIAIGLGADKLVFMHEAAGLQRELRGTSTLLCTEVEALLAARTDLPEELAGALHAAADAATRGVERVHLLERVRDGVLLREFFTRDGAGTLISGRPFEDLRRARIDDVAGILELLQPLEEQGVLVRRSRERLENEIDHFYVIDRDGWIIGCAALYPYPAERMGELACVTVHSDYRNAGRAEQLLGRIEAQARRERVDRLFALTTQTEHWFIDHGFVQARLEELPTERQGLYNYRRNSKVFIKSLG